MKRRRKERKVRGCEKESVKVRKKTERLKRKESKMEEGIKNKQKETKLSERQEEKREIQGVVRKRVRNKRMTYMGRGRKKIDQQKRVNYKMKREKDEGVVRKRYEKQKR